MKNSLLLFLFVLAAFAGTLQAKPPQAKRIVFLGDSITHAGQYIEYVETVLMADTDLQHVVLDLGLSSETVSGLSEEGHADGKFPRPDLHERLERVLTKTKPDLVIACYGMNDGIYLPQDPARFQKYKDGIEWLRGKVRAVGADIIHLTPPPFDPGPEKKKTPYYDGVLTDYSKWLLAQRKQNWHVIDIHGPMAAALAAKRAQDPKFFFAKDGVHPNEAGHWLMAQQILKDWGVKQNYTLEDFTAPTGRLYHLHQLVAQRLKTLSAAYLSAAGHKRPGVKPGLPLPEAETQAAALTKQIEAIRHDATKRDGAPAAPNAAPGASTPTPAKSANATPAPFPGVLGDWHGFDKYDFQVDGKPVTVVVPKQAAPGKPWEWHGEFFGHKPDPDIALLGKGFHVVYMKINDMLGCPEAVQHWNALYDVLTKQYGFSKKPALTGLSRGGLYVYNWAIANPTKVSCIYGDAPVCDFKSWPGGKGKGKGDPHNWQLVLKLWGFKDEAEALAYKGNPIDNLEPLAAAKVPLLHVYGDADDVVPPAENTLLLAERYRKLGGTIELIGKAGVGHHPHGLQDSTPIVDFILKNTK